jgi:hypothetical protein
MTSRRDFRLWPPPPWRQRMPRIDLVQHRLNASAAETVLPVTASAVSVAALLRRVQNERPRR